MKKSSTFGVLGVILFFADDSVTVHYGLAATTLIVVWHAEKAPGGNEALRAKN